MEEKDITTFEMFLCEKQIQLKVAWVMKVMKEHGVLLIKSATQLSSNYTILIIVLSALQSV